MEDDFDWIFEKEPVSENALRRIGAVDISYHKKDSNIAIAALIICEYPSFKVLYEDFETDLNHYPYVPGFLAFREVPSISILFARLSENRPDLEP